MSSRRRRRSAGVAAPSGPALVNHTAIGGNNTFSSGAISTLTANFIVIGLTCKFGVTPTISDSKNNTWHPLTQKNSPNAAYSRLYYAENAVVDAAHVFTVTGVSMLASICVAAFSGMLGASSLQIEGAGGTLNNATTVQPGSVTPALSKHLIITHLDYETVAQNPTINLGFTITDKYLPFAGVGSNYGGALAFLTGSAAPTNPTWTTPSADYGASTISVFKAA